MGKIDQVLGNHSIKEYIKSAMRLNRISHSYIIEGEKGSGKKMLAESFASILQCEQGAFPECGNCESCIQIDHGNHPDVILVKHEKEKTISVQDIRDQIVSTAEIKPYRGPYKIYIVDEAEKMTQEAQNALLKTIEEPPEYVVIFLLVNNRGTLLETILSRCILLETEPVRQGQIREYLRQHRDLPEEEIEFASGFSMGNIGKGLAVLDSRDFWERKEISLSLLRSIPSIRVEDINKYTVQLKQHKNRIQDVFDIFLIWYRDLLILKTTGQRRRLVFSGEYEHLLLQCDIISFESLDRIIRDIEKAENRVRANVNYEALLLVLFTRIRREYRLEE